MSLTDRMATDDPEAVEWHSITCWAGGFDGFDCDHPHHRSGKMEAPPEGAFNTIRGLTSDSTPDLTRRNRG